MAGIIRQKTTVIPALVAIMKRIVLMLNISADAMQPVRCPRRWS